MAGGNWIRTYNLPITRLLFPQRHSREQEVSVETPAQVRVAAVFFEGLQISNAGFIKPDEAPELRKKTHMKVHAGGNTLICH